jgi:hypothetical protein
MPQNRFVKQLPSLAALTGVFAFVFLSGSGSPGKFISGLVSDPLDTPLFVAPCLIFGLTVHAYSRFIIAYRGRVAGVSLIFLLLALVCCMGLVVKHDWWIHLRYMYLLFYSYVVWDILMVDVFLKHAPLQESELSEEYEKHMSEIRVVTTYINRPTLITIFGVWLYAAVYLPHQLDNDTIKHFVAGVISFHLIFSSVAYCLAYFFCHSDGSVGCVTRNNEAAAAGGRQSPLATSVQAGSADGTSSALKVDDNSLG